MSEGDVFAVLVLEGEGFYFVARFHGSLLLVLGCDLFGQNRKGLVERSRIFDVEGFLVAIDLAHKSGEDLAWACFDEVGDTLGNEEVDALDPANGTGDLAYQAVADFGAVGEKAGVYIGGYGEVRVGEG